MSVYSVDAGDPFLVTLAARLLDGTLWPGGAMPSDPLAITTATVYLPTRRAARVLATAFLDVAGGPTALPRIEALGESDEEDPAHARIETVGLIEARAALAALVSAFARRLEADMDPDQRVLMPNSAPDAIRLADDLLALMDQVETQEADWADLPGLVERADLAAHWELTTRFLTIATHEWPAYLAEANRISEAAARRLDAQAAVAALDDARGPMIVAGSTGSIPATRRLIAAIAQHPFGAVVLPGFDRAATADDWATLAEAGDAPGHPQHGLRELVEALGITSEVARLVPPGEATTAGVKARRDLLRAALRPAPTTHLWLDDRAATDLAAALGDVALVDAEDERVEAAAIAVAMREAVEHGEAVALITPHRALARRVSHALRRWQITIDDSAGEPLAATEAGVFARLVAAVALDGAAAEW
ncbi:MAG: double-strand break repair protein AddB, partial [Pseudomonadota bacterium]